MAIAEKIRARRLINVFILPALSCPGGVLVGPAAPRVINSLKTM